MPILSHENYQQLNDRIRSFTVLSWYCKTFIDDAHALFRDSDFRHLLDVTARCTQKKYTAGNQLKEVSSQSVKDAILIRNKKIS
jgi:hypothetical protein